MKFEAELDSRSYILVHSAGAVPKRVMSCPGPKPYSGGVSPIDECNEEFSEAATYSMNSCHV